MVLALRTSGIFLSYSCSWVSVDLLVCCEGCGIGPFGQLPVHSLPYTLISSVEFCAALLNVRRIDLLLELQSESQSLIFARTFGLTLHWC